MKTATKAMYGHGILYIPRDAFIVFYIIIRVETHIRASCRFLLLLVITEFLNTIKIRLMMVEHLRCEIFRWGFPIQSIPKAYLQLIYR